MSTPKETWDAFLDLLTTKSDGSWYFRGQKNARWGLRPSAGRSGISTKTEFFKEEEIDILTKFKQNAIRYIDRIESEIEWLAVAQHHGVPTRLLDWSTNPLIAAWFACEGDEDENGRIHMIRVRRSQVDQNVIDPFDDKYATPAMVSVSPRTARIFHQQGLFSLHGQVNEDWKPSSNFAYEIFDIPASQRLFFQRKLYILGIDRSRMMGDLDGLGATIAWQYKTRG